MTTNPTAYIEVLARLLCAADVHVHGDDHPTWQQLVGDPGQRTRDDYRKAAAWLATRLTVNAETRLSRTERRCDELRAESKRRGKTVLEYSERIRALEREVDGLQKQLGAEILRAGQAEVVVSGPPATRAADRDRAAAPVKQRADCTELEWAEQERARFERLYTREYTRAEQAEDLLKVAHETSNRSEAERASAVQRAETAERDTEIYRKRLERLGEGYTEQRQRAEEAEARAAAMERDLAASERIRENADFHLGQEMGRRQLAEKEAARLSADRAAVLNAAAQHLYTALFPAVYADMGQKAAEGVQRAVSELRRMADEAQQQPDTETPEAATVYLSTRCDACQHTLNWHRNDVGCTVVSCVCGSFQPPADEDAS